MCENMLVYVGEREREWVSQGEHERKQGVK